jgi:hypothetical protein
MGCKGSEVRIFSPRPKIKAGSGIFHYRLFHFYPYKSAISIISPSLKKYGAAPTLTSDMAHQFPGYVMVTTS